MELIKSVARRSKVSDVAYVLLNIALAIAIYVLTIAFTPPYFAYALVLLSKWRVFAVRPRFWLANIQGNMVDALVGVSTVTLIWRADGQMVVQVLLTVLYIAWLLILKPRSRRKVMIAQAEISQFIALIALFGVAHYLDSSIVVALCWVIGYVAAWHGLQSYDEDDVYLLSFIWGLVIAELGWLSYQWTSAYTLAGDLMVPQGAIIVGLVGHLMMQAYNHQYHKTLTWKRLRAPVLFSILVVAMMLLRELSVLAG